MKGELGKKRYIQTKQQQTKERTPLLLLLCGNSGSPCSPPCLSFCLSTHFARSPDPFSKKVRKERREGSGKKCGAREER